MKDVVYKYCEKHKEDGDLTMSFKEMMCDLDCARKDLIYALCKLEQEGYLSFNIYELPGGIPYDEEISITIWEGLRC